MRAARHWRSSGGGPVRGAVRRRLVVASALAGLLAVFAEPNQSALAVPSLPYVMTLGGAGSCPAARPTCGHAQLYPSGGDVDPAGIVYTADTGNDQVEAWNADGTQRWRIGFRGPGTRNGGRFQNPRDLAYADGKLYVADLGNNRVQVLDATQGTWLSTWSARFTSIIGISAGVDPSGNRIILTANDADGVIRTYTPAGVPLRTIGSKCTPVDGVQCPLGGLAAPRDATTDAAGNVYVADFANDRIQEFTADGSHVLRAWGSRGIGNGQFNRPYGVSIDASGRVYVADSANGRLQQFTATGVFLKQYGMEVTDNKPGPGEFFTVRRVAVGPGANPLVYGFDLWGSSVQRFTQTGASDRVYSGVAAADGAFNEIYGVDVADDGVYTSDTDNQRMQRFDPASGAWKKTWGQRGFGESNLGFNWPRDLAFSSATDTTWVADTKNNRVTEFNFQGVPTRRQIGKVPGSSRGQLDWPYAVATVRGEDRVIVADTNNNRIELWDPSLTEPLWIATTAMGKSFNGPRDVTWAVDPVLGAVVYVADSINNRVVRLKASTGAAIDAFAPKTSAGAPVLHRVDGIAVDPRNGDIWIADTSFNRLVELNHSGAVVLVVGKTGSAHGEFSNPTHLAIDSNPLRTRLYVADTWNDRIEVFNVSKV